MRTFLGHAAHTYNWCVSSDHWSEDSHPLGNLTDPLNPVWDETCRLNTVSMGAGSLLSIDHDAKNGPHVAAQCQAHESQEVYVL